MRHAQDCDNRKFRQVEIEDCPKRSIYAGSAMSWCSEWLRIWMKNGNRTRSDLATLAEVDPANVSRWLSGHSKPDRSAIETLSKALDNQDAADLLIAWLQDLLPDGWDKFLRVERKFFDTSSSFVRDSTIDYKPSKRSFPPGMSDELVEQLIFFGTLAVTNPDIRKIIEVCFEAAKRPKID